MYICFSEPDNHPQATLDALYQLKQQYQQDSRGILWVGLGRWVGCYLMDSVPDLRVIVSPTTGLDHIDLDECQERGITVLSLQGETEFLQDIRATAEHTLALMLALLRDLPWAHQDVVENYVWRRQAHQGTELGRQTVGLVGLGRVGSQVAGLVQAFGARVVWSDPYHQPAADGKSLAEVCQLADLVSVHVPLDQETYHLIGRDQLAAMRPGTYLVNTSRGDVLDEAAVVEALESGQLKGVAVDVLSGEPDPAESRLYQWAIDNAGRVIITPHIGGCTRESIALTEAFMVRKLAQFLGALVKE